MLKPNVQAPRSEQRQNLCWTPFSAILLMRLRMQMTSMIAVAEEQVIRTLQERMKRAPVVYPRGQPPDCTVESYSFAVLALRNHRGSEYIRALDSLLTTQNSDGSWPAFSGDDARGCWTTA